MYPIHIHTHIQHMPTGPATPKTTAFVHHAAMKATTEGFVHYLGQKGLPMFASLDNYDYKKFNHLELMHNLSRILLWLSQLTVGPNGTGNPSKRW